MSSQYEIDTTFDFRDDTRGMWLGFGRDFTINSGEWELTWQEASTAKATQRRYHAKV